jgi:hypothetical protein
VARKSKHVPPVALPEPIKEYDRIVKPEKIVADSIVVSDRRPRKAEAVLSAPPPWTQPWLDEHGLRVVYRNGAATLAFKI